MSRTSTDLDDHLVEEGQVKKERDLESPIQDSKRRETFQAVLEEVNKVYVLP